MSSKVCKTPPSHKTMRLRVQKGDSDTNSQAQEKTSVIDYYNDH